MKGEVLDSIAPVKVLLSGIIIHLKLKQKPFEIQPAATDGEIKVLWDTLLQINPSLNFSDKMNKSSLGNHPKIQRFMSHCC